MLVTYTQTADFTITYSGGQPPACINRQDTVFVQYTGSFPADSFEWLFCTGCPWLRGTGLSDTFYVHTTHNPVTNSFTIRLIAHNTGTGQQRVVDKVVYVSDLPNPVITISPSATPLCSQDTLTFALDNYSGIYQVDWYIDQMWFPNQLSVNYQYGSVGSSDLTDTIRAIIYTACGTDTLQMIRAISDTGKPTVAFSMEPNSPICPGQQIHFRPLGSFATTSTSFLWDFGDGNTSTSAYATHTFSAPGTYTVNLTVTNACGNSNSFSTNVLVTNNGTPPAISLMPGMPLPICPGVRFPLSISISPSDPAHIIRIDWGDGSPLETHTGSSLSFTNVGHVYASPGNYTIVVEVEDVCGNLIASSLNVTVSTTPSISGALIHYPDSICGLQDTVEVWASGGYRLEVDTIIWFVNDVPADTLPSTFPFVISGLAPSTEIKAKMHTYCGTYILDSIQIPYGTGTGIFAEVTPSSISSVHCAGEQVDLSARLLPPYRYKIDTAYWDFGDGNTAVTTGKQFTHFTTHQYSAPGIYPVHVRTVNGCLTTEAGNLLTIRDQSVLLLANSVLVWYPNGSCSEVPVSLYVPVLEGKADSFYWDLGDGNTQVTTFGYVEHQYASPGTYTVRVRATGACNTQDSVTTTIQILEASPATVAFSAPNGACVNVPVTFQNNTTGTYDSLIWDFGDGTQLVQTTATDVTHTYTEPGWYAVTLTAITGGNCKPVAHQWFPVTPNTPPIADFQWIANNLTVFFFNTSIYATDFTWDFGDGTTSNDVNPTHTYNAPGTYQVTLIAQNPCGYSDILTRTITVGTVSGLAMSDVSTMPIALYPNPAIHTVTIDLTAMDNIPLTVSLHTLEGREVYHATIQSGNRHTIHVDDLPPGTYILRIRETDTGTMIGVRVVSVVRE